MPAHPDRRFTVEELQGMVVRSHFRNSEDGETYSITGPDGDHDRIHPVALIDQLGELLEKARLLMDELADRDRERDELKATIAAHDCAYESEGWNQPGKENKS